MSTYRGRASGAWVNVVVRGPLFEKKIDKVVKAALIDECLKRIQKEEQIKTDRLIRKRTKYPSGRVKGLGAKRNPITREMLFGQSNLIAMGFKSPTNFPRTKGTKWVVKNIAWIRAMVPRVLKKAAARMVSELN